MGHLVGLRMGQLVGPEVSAASQASVSSGGLAWKGVGERSQSRGPDGVVLGRE